MAAPAAIPTSYTTLTDFDAEKGAGINDRTGGTDTASISTAASGTLTLTNASNGIDAYTIASTGAVSINAAAVTTGLTLTGGNGANTLTGTNFADIISGGIGIDILNGGGDDDLFLYAASTEFTGAERIDGGAGIDTIRISAPSGIVNLTAVVTNIEFVELTGTGDNGVSAALVTTGLTITGNGGANTITGTNAVDYHQRRRSATTPSPPANGTDIVLNGGEGSDTYIVQFPHRRIPSSTSLTDTGTGSSRTSTRSRITATSGTPDAYRCPERHRGLHHRRRRRPSASTPPSAVTTGLTLTGSSAVAVNTLTGTAFRQT
jgi:hypothetical protein